jgi:hypothetical protein
MILYHFTSLNHLPKICKSCFLKYGDIPLRQTTNYGEDGHGVWLTTTPNSTPDQHGLKNPLVDKTMVRFKIDIDESSPQLFKWSDYAKINKVKREWYKRLDKVGGGLSHTWWLYIGEIDIRLSQVEISIKENNVFIPKLTDHILKIYTPHPN